MMPVPRIALIVAMAENRVIGRDGGMPWHLPQDLKFFKQTTMGKPMIMGRRTFESIGKPLPGRTTIVVTRSDMDIPGVTICRSIADALDEGLRVAVASGADEVMVVGGGQIYADTMAMADRIYLTRIGMAVDGDTWFPELASDKWSLVQNVPAKTEGEEPALTFQTFDKVA